jgi:alkylation response protein AidB-like acyl-CoA dehydrogenase
LTEPEAGSDAGSTRTTAVLDDARAEWVVNGTKAFITNSGTDITALVTITARTGGPASGGPDTGGPASGGPASGGSGSGAPEISCIIVPAGTPGFGVDPPYRKMGWHASDTHGLTFSDCRVPAGNLLGERGRGVAQFLQILDEGRIAIAAVAVGVIRCCLEQSVAYANDRQAFGRAIGANQAVAFACSDLAVMAETASLLVYQAAWLRDSGKPYRRAAAMAKLHATEAAVTATRMATQVFGGYGFMDETLVARQYRDAKILEIGEGTSEIQRLIIARELGLPT